MCRSPSCQPLSPTLPLIGGARWLTQHHTHAETAWVRDNLGRIWARLSLSTGITVYTHCERGRKGKRTCINSQFALAVCTADKAQPHADTRQQQPPRPDAAPQYHLVAERCISRIHPGRLPEWSARTEQWSENTHTHTHTHKQSCLHDFRGHYIDLHWFLGDSLKP